MTDVPWREVEALPYFNGALTEVPKSVDTLRKAWKRSIDLSSREQFEQARKRSLRKHAIETGIIERLYEVDWGVTEALIAEGLTLEVAVRAGGITEDALETINAQFDVLAFLAERARRGDELTMRFIRGSHGAIPRTQVTFNAVDNLGRHTLVPLRRGAWKTSPNHVPRQDGSRLEFTPPGRVDDQMERLVALYAQTWKAHPIIRAARPHHRFTERLSG